MRKRKTIIENAWVTKAGLPAVIIMTETGHRCGYVGVLPGHSLHRVGYTEDTFALLPPAPETPVGKRGVFTLFSVSLTGVISRSPDMVFDVHGGVTFSGDLNDLPEIEERLNEYDIWWFGYDCAHYGDCASPEYLAEQKARYPDKPFMWRENGVHRTHAYCVAECESLASQIKVQAVAPWRAWLRKVFYHLHHWKS